MRPFWNALRAMNHGIRMMISRIGLDRPDRLRMLPYDRFKFYAIAPIVRIELSSIQKIAVVLVVRIVSDRPGRISI